MQRLIRLLSLICLLSVLAACGSTVDSGFDSPPPPNSSVGNSENRSRQTQPTPFPATDNTLAEATEAPAEAALAAAPTMEMAPETAADEQLSVDSAAPGAPAQQSQAETGRTTVEEPPPPPEEVPNDSMYFQNYGINPFISTADDRLSTFAMDVDSASYTLMRSYVEGGSLPPAASVRVEEYLNYFDYAYPQPQSGDFAVYAEAAPSPFGGPGYELVQFGIQGRDINAADRKPAALTFVIDVSGSMADGDRLGAVKHALTQLVGEMRPEDSIAIAVYGSNARAVLEPTSGDQQQRIIAAINSVQAEGSTNVQAGLQVGFGLAEQAFKPEGINMIILCSDGVANNGVTDPQSLLDLYARQINQGVQLSTYGFGMGNYNDILMEQLANGGDGAYAYIDSRQEAERIFVQNLTGTLQTIARDAKIQVEFNPDVVQHYRLVGYENRDVADTDFRNDSIDAGEVGAGHSVTAMYEIKRFPDAAGEIAAIRLRYQPAGGGEVVETGALLSSASIHPAISEASPRFKLAASVTQFAEQLRHSHWIKNQNLEDLIGLADQAAQEMPENQAVAEYRRLLIQASQFAQQ